MMYFIDENSGGFLSHYYGASRLIAAMASSPDPDLLARALALALDAKRSRPSDISVFFGAVGVTRGGRDAQPALVIGRHCTTERDSAPVQYNGIV